MKFASVVLQNELQDFADYLAEYVRKKDCESMTFRFGAYLVFADQVNGPMGHTEFQISLKIMERYPRRKLCSWEDNPFHYKSCFSVDSLSAVAILLARIQQYAEMDEEDSTYYSHSTC